MIKRTGRLLVSTLNRIAVGPATMDLVVGERSVESFEHKLPTHPLAAEEASHFADIDEAGELPLVFKLSAISPKQGETWRGYRSRVADRLAPAMDHLKTNLGVRSTPLLAANALQIRASVDAVREMYMDRALEAELVELDPLLQATLMDDVIGDVGVPDFRIRHDKLDGTGVTVAVLDSGVDLAHPNLEVTDSISTNGEDVSVPGSHGTHCAGSIASRDSVFAGVAPGVSLLNIKVLAASGVGRHTDIVKGVDEALDREAHVLSMSVGFNHLPRWAPNGHGWECPDGRCPLCSAIDNAVTLDNTLAVVAAGNEHDTAQALRSSGNGEAFDTEIACPGHAAQALTVGALTKRTFLPASFSSRGPTAYGLTKPILAAPGVNVTSTVPVPRDGAGTLEPNPSRGVLFARKSGTSMATPVVAGIAALLIQQAIESREAWTPGEINAQLVKAIAVLPQEANIVGAGLASLVGI